MRFPVALTFDDVLLVPAYSDILPAEACLRTDLGRGLVLQLPLLSAAMDTVTEVPMAVALARCGGLGVLHKNCTPQVQAGWVRDIKRQSGDAPATVDGRGKLRVAAAIGVGSEGQARLQALVRAKVDAICIDTAHGHSRGVLDAVRAARRDHPDLCIWAGNVATAEATVALAEAGADLIKVGIGPGSICTTRLVAGIGVPQLSAILACAPAAADAGVRLIADGGLRLSGDLVKALAGGADAVMLGSLLAAADEAPGERLEVNGRAYKTYRGMGSEAAMRAGSADRYFQDGSAPGKLVPEGVEGRLPCAGSTADIVHGLQGGLRAGMGYLGAADLAALRARARFVRLSPAGMRESRVHDVETDPAKE